MTYYQELFDPDGPHDGEYNAVTRRSLQYLEDELTKLVDADSGGHTWREDSANKSLDTVYTNNSGGPRFVAVTVKMEPDTLNSIETRARLSIDTPVRTVDGFEDGDLSEYVGETGSFSVQGTTVKVGSNALKAENETNTGITSALINEMFDNTFAPLDHYPLPGDTFDCWVRIDSQGDSGNAAAIGWASNNLDQSGNNPDGYKVQVSADNSNFELKKRDGGQSTSLASAAPTLSNDTWYRVHVDWGTDGTMTCKLYDDTGSLVETISATDTTFKEGGISFFLNASGGSGSANDACYWDDFRIREQSNISASDVGVGSGGVSDSERHVIYGVVPDGADYTAKTLSLGQGGSISIDLWFEFDFDEAHTAQTWSHGDPLYVDGNGGTPNVNTYLGGVNNIGQTDQLSPPEGQTTHVPASLDTEDTVSALTILAYSHQLGTSLSAGDSSLQIKDSGGTLTDVERLSVTSSDNFRRAYFGVINADGAYKVVTNSGATSASDGFEGEFDVPSITLVSNGDNLDPQLKNADTRAGEAWNTSVPPAILEPSGTSLRQPSTDNIVLVVVSAKLQPTADSKAVLELRSGDGNELHTVEQPDGTRDVWLTIPWVLKPGSDYSVELTNASLIGRTEWVLRR